MTAERAHEIRTELAQLYRERAGSEYFGEAVTELAHAEQAAALARQAGADDEMVLASLLHDLGHLLERGREDEEVGVIDHDTVAGAWLRERGFRERLVRLVEGHVAAKRYLVATNPAYQAKLSPASIRTLELQGGPMAYEEAVAFGQDPLLKEKLRLRHWDELAKDPAAVPSFESHLPVLVKYLIATTVEPKSAQTAGADGSLQWGNTE